MSEAAAPRGLGSHAGIARVLSDDRLARRAVRGDERAFAAIFSRYHQALYRYCLAIVGNAEDAQDALQNTMVKVLRALPGEERRIELKPWLYRIAHNESIELIRRRRETGRLDPELAAAGPGPVEEAAVRERLRGLISDLDELPERQRGALLMRELAGLGIAEIGAALGTTPGVARQTLYEARLSLRQMDEGREMSCATVTKALSDGDGRVIRRRDLRAHLRSCASCRGFREEIKGRERDLASLTPLPAAVAAGLLQGLLGGAAKSLGTSVAVKGAATVAVVATIGVGAADRGGMIDVGLPGGDSRATPAKRPAEVGPARTRPTETGSTAIEATAGPAAMRRAGRLDPRRTASQAAAVKQAAAGGGQDTGAVSTPASRSAPTPRHHDKRHEKQLPSASAHGQQTAAAHKATNRGSAGSGSHPAHPAKPAHPPRPSSSGAKGPPSPPPSGVSVPAGPAPGNAAPPAAEAKGASAKPEAGKKP